jgi:hypothetical protein
MIEIVRTAETIIRPLNRGQYEVYVLNTSGIGFIDGFTWSPAPGWTITAIAKATGANCKLTGGGPTCAGRVLPPSCKGDGGSVTIKLDVKVNASPASAQVSSYGAVRAKLRITHMTAVPYLIPGTPSELARQQGV